MHRALIVTSLGLAALALAACTSAEELRQADARACQSYGFAPGTPAFANCLQRENLTRSQSSYPPVSVGVGGGFFGGGGGFGGAGVGLGF